MHNAFVSCGQSTNAFRSLGMCCQMTHNDSVGCQIQRRWLKSFVCVRLELRWLSVLASVLASVLCTRFGWLASRCLRRCRWRGGLHLCTLVRGIHKTRYPSPAARLVHHKRPRGPASALQFASRDPVIWILVCLTLASEDWMKATPKRKVLHAVKSKARTAPCGPRRAP
jgi:hypothetical protein